MGDELRELGIDLRGDMAPIDEYRSAGWVGYELAQLDAYFGRSKRARIFGNSVATLCTLLPSIWDRSVQASTR